MQRTGYWGDARAHLIDQNQSEVFLNMASDGDEDATQFGVNSEFGASRIESSQDKSHITSRAALGHNNVRPDGDCIKINLQSDHNLTRLSTP